MRSNFLLGALRVTKAARLRLRRVPLDLIARHAVNEHGLATPEELKANAMAMKTLDEIKSRYYVDPTDPSQGTVLVITEAGAGSTRVKLERRRP